MKRKIKFNNQNFKHKFKIFVLVFILIACVYFLYFNNKILVQSTIQNSLNNEETTKSNSIENFDVSRYVDVCKNRKTNFYDFKMDTTLSTLPLYDIVTNENCEQKCNDTSHCQFFLMKENAQGVVDNSKCYLYIKELDPSYNDNSLMNIKVNCNSTLIPNSTSSLYNGFGYINKKYFEYNKDKFSYKDVYLDKANEIIPTLKANRTNLNALATSTPSTHKQLTTNDDSYRATMNEWITSFSALIDFSKNKLTSYIDDNDNDTDMFNDDILENTKNKQITHLAAISKETPELDNKLADVKSSGYVNKLFYTILAFIMIITIILLILYKLNANAIISDRFMIIYFIVIVILFMFIRFMLNK
jgi:hypothetical protein